MDTFFALLFEPIKRWLMDQGVWNTLVEFLNAISRLFEKLTGWLGIETPQGGVIDFLVGALKLMFNIFVTVIKVLIDIINWIINLF